MSWIQRNMLLTVVLGIATVAALALAVLIFMSWSQYSAISSDYDQQATELKRLERATIYPSQENVDEMERQKKEYAARLSDLRFQLSQLQMPSDPDISPNAFQDKLRATVSEIQQLAADNNVSLPEEFYLGFDIYQDTLPSRDAAPELSRQLDTAKLVVQQLIELGINELTYIIRQPLPVEGGEQAEPTPPQAPPGQVLQQEIMATMQTYDFGFISTPATLRAVVNAIDRAESFVILRTLLVKNEVQVGPEKSAFADQGTATAAATQNTGIEGLFEDALGTSEESGTEKRLEFVVGAEKVQVDMQIQIVNFPNPQAAGEPENEPQQ